jgi:preprotein translocase subunit YajC
MINKIVQVITLVLAGCLPVFAQDAQAAAPNPLGSFVPLIVIFGIFYFLMIRPQQKKMKEHQKTLNALKKDDKIITSGGLYATVIGVKGEVVEAKIAENVKVQIAKSAVSTVVNEQQENVVVTPEIIK